MITPLIQFVAKSEALNQDIISIKVSSEIEYSASSLAYRLDISNNFNSSIGHTLKSTSGMINSPLSVPSVTDRGKKNNSSSSTISSKSDELALSIKFP